MYRASDVSPLNVPLPFRADQPRGAVSRGRRAGLREATRVAAWLGCLMLAACGYDPSSQVTPEPTTDPYVTTPTPISTPTPEVTFTPCEDQDGDGRCAANDCDDTDVLVYPGAQEACDGKDNNCDGTVFEDVDQDGAFNVACKGKDCDDANSTIYPGAKELCDGKDTDCAGGLSLDEQDNDGDGKSECDGDCNDENVDIYPGAIERNNCLDDNCDGTIPSGEKADEDGDGSPSCLDCNDQNISITPGRSEVCDGLDNNCDGTVPAEEADADKDGSRGCGGDCDDLTSSVYPGATELCNGVDDDCKGGLPSDELDQDSDGQRVCQGDCDDLNAAVAAGRLEVCDGIDNDCDGSLDEGFDADEDGFTVCQGDCADSDTTVYPKATELCDGKDNNCDGIVPEGEILDQDADGYVACNDCDPYDALSYPGAEERCDQKDNDCDGKKDDGIKDGLEDADGDGVVDCLDTCPRWVDGKASPGGDGSYITPYQTIQEAIDAAAPDEPEGCRYIQVRPGAYLENIDYFGKGIELEASQPSAAEETVIDGGDAGPAVSFVTGETSEALLQAFVITGGRATCGGGVHIYQSSPTLLNNTIRDNEAELGGGVCIEGTGTPELSDNHVEYNTARAAGGGVWLGSGSRAELHFNFMDSNLSFQDGGGLFCEASSSTDERLIINSNTVQYNSASSRGGGLYVSRGCRATFTGNVMLGNEAQSGGGAVLEAPSASLLSLSSGSFDSNVASDCGGGVVVSGSAGVKLKGMIIQYNKTLGNVSGLCGSYVGAGGGIVAEPGASLTLDTVTLLLNRAQTIGGGLYGGESSSVTWVIGMAKNNKANLGAGLYIDLYSTLNTGSGGNVTLEANEAVKEGGGLYMRGVTQGSLQNLKVLQNAAYDGAGIAAYMVTATFTGCNVTNNVATGSAAVGGILCGPEDPQLRYQGCNLAGNTPSPQTNCPRF